MNNYDKFIGKLYDILLESDIISYEDKPKDLKEKKERLEKYLDKLDRVQSKAMSKEEHVDTLKRLYYDKYVIKPENIPDGYFKSLEKRYLDEGHGHHNLINPDNETDKRLKEQHINVIIREQKDSLDSWLNYFLSKDSDYLPMWAKVWAFQGMLGIGNLNKEKDGYGRRSNTAVNPFVSLDSEILSKCVELVKETFNNKEVNDKEIEKLIVSGSFAKLYGKLLANKKQLKVSSNEGIWIKYNYESEEQANKKIKEGQVPEYLKLYNSLQGYNTGWCTAGSKETAKNQICGGGSYQGGDFYVYYTKNKDNEYKIPRIAIRMNGEDIGEIRGVAEGQNIESNMDSVLEEKLKEFPDGALYQKKVHDMKMLTQIYDNYQNRELTKDELIFLYELNHKISGFGYETDPRIKEIRNKRNQKKDISTALNCDESEIGLTEKDLYKNQLVYYSGNIYDSMYNEIKKRNLELPKYLDGILCLNEKNTPKELMLPQKINGDYICLNSLTSAEGLIFPEEFSGTIALRGLTSAEGLILPKDFTGDLILNNLTSAKGLILPPSINYSIYLNGLQSIEGLNLPQSIDGSLDLSGLTTANGLTLPKAITGSLALDKLTSAKGLKLPQNIGGSLYLKNLTSADGLILPEKIGGDLHLSRLASAEGLVIPQNIKGSLYLNSLKTAKGLILPEKIDYELDLSGLISAEGLKLPENFNGDLVLSSLTSAKGLKLPQNIGGYLDLNRLIYADELVLPKHIGRDLLLNGLIYAEGLVLPQSIGGFLDLGQLLTLKGVTLPNSVGGMIIFNHHAYTLEQIKELQQEETNRSAITINRKGFTTGICTITMVLITTILSIVIAILLLNK